MPVARQTLQAAGASGCPLFFVDDQPTAAWVNGHKVLSYTEFRSLECAEARVVIAIANGQTRQALASRLFADGVKPWTIIADNAVIMDAVDLGAGSAVSPFVTCGANVRIGRHFHANLYSYVEHDCVIGDYVTFAPGVKCNGNIVIEDHAYIGAGAVIKQGQPGKPLVIGQGAVVGMGAVVTKDVPAGVTVVGNPARIMSR